MNKRKNQPNPIASTASTAFDVTVHVATAIGTLPFPITLVTGLTKRPAVIIAALLVTLCNLAGCLQYKQDSSELGGSDSARRMNAASMEDECLASHVGSGPALTPALSPASHPATSKELQRN
ncbi:hypothetical protein F5X98DRAFT_328368 [Xylaria grammica]|nr:hypothetical protein F5X98DRAFT_328368 [Xylaria grammica]